MILELGESGQEEFKYIACFRHLNHDDESSIIYMMTSSNENVFRVTGHLLRGIHRSRVNSPHKGQWRGALMFSLICARINASVNNGEAGDFRRNHVHYDVIVMNTAFPTQQWHTLTGQSPRLSVRVSLLCNCSDYALGLEPILLKRFQSQLDLMGLLFCSHSNSNNLEFDWCKVFHII